MGDTADLNRLSQEIATLTADATGYDHRKCADASVG